MHLQHVTHVALLTMMAKACTGFLGTAIQPGARQWKPIHAASQSVGKGYNATIEALRAYYSVHGNLVIPRRYIVPNDDVYPPEFHGVDLSGMVYKMEWWQSHIKSRPERVSELTSLGFVWERLQPEWNLVLEALITYSELYGDLLVPNKFVVPNNDHWARATWGLNLGNCVYRIRARNDFLRGSNAYSRKEQLDGLGFVWDAYEERYHKFYAALWLYAKINKLGKFSKNRVPLIVPFTFRVPNEKAWPEDLWGYPLGVKCNAVLQKSLYVNNKHDRQQQLEELGFRWTGATDMSWLKVVHAAAIYSRLHDRVLSVPNLFVVPHCPEGEDVECWPWPEYLWGLPLGQRLKNVRQKGLYLNGDKGVVRRQQLDALGFVWEPRRGRPKSITVTDKACAYKTSAALPS